MIKAWACNEPKGKLAEWSYKPRELGPQDVEIKIDCCGICGSDVHYLDGDWGNSKYPAVVGHEIIGQVVSKGAEVTHLSLGDRVGVGAQVFSCMEPDCISCSRDLHPHCKKQVLTYGGKYADGEQSRGGYAEAVRVNAHFAFKIPEKLSSAEAAPLMCAGTTVFTPMIRFGLKKGDRVGVVGIGGLGHLALQFANALGCEVTAFSHSPNKKEECLKLGANKVVITTDEEEVRKCARSLDYLFITSNAKTSDFSAYFTWVDFGGKICLLAAPASKLEFSPALFIHNEVYIGGSAIGGIETIKETLDFAAKNNVRPIIERLPMSRCNEGVERVRDGKVRYRVVLENRPITSSML
ncbi:putative mannitol dehydrogenase [Zancudomyces culisetae]|uniref:Putative mannitol dehydrogenase n=1 Tax=Zancudomyces culisetae TaxID=1213189 RepID=A0A1R1PZH4_ZANCU|nr:putative mannitol dehydrogenase [Zancudomyces culisetae]|eukprot:OMH86356.1 putative mannitol dehydrogenase [Zancudomyces culisetae]